MFGASEGIWIMHSGDSTSINSLLTSANDLPLEEFDWGTLRWLCNDRLSPGTPQTLGICHIWPGKKNPLHFHPNCEELLHVLAGRGRHRLGRDVVDLAAGMTLRIPVRTHHNFENIGEETLVCLICFSAGARETVFLGGEP